MHLVSNAVHVEKWHLYIFKQRVEQPKKGMIALCQHCVHFVAGDGIVTLVCPESGRILSALLVSAP